MYRNKTIFLKYTRVLNFINLNGYLDRRWYCIIEIFTTGLRNDRHILILTHFQIIKMVEFIVQLGYRVKWIYI